jgi:hypothetical protein
LRNPNRRLIVGGIEGNIPYFLQNETQAELQADFDKIKAQAAISLVANSLIQTGTMPKFDAELIRMRAQLYRTRVSAIDSYNDEYGDLIASNSRLKLTVPQIANRYIRTPELPKTQSPVTASGGWGKAKVVGN